MTVWEEIVSNKVLVSAVTGWIVAQLLKTLIDFGFTKTFTAERLVGSGGMPSSHAATVCALTASSVFTYGIASFEFAISFVLAMVVMYDAIGVRQETGKQAKLLNMIMEQDFWDFKDGGAAFQKKLKEFVGHTPLQVFIGALLGIIIALVIDIVY